MDASSTNIEHKSKFYNCMWALIKSKQYTCYAEMDKLIEEGLQKRGIAIRESIHSIKSQLQTIHHQNQTTAPIPPNLQNDEVKEDANDPSHPRNESTHSTPSNQSTHSIQPNQSNHSLQPNQHTVQVSDDANGQHATKVDDHPDAEQQSDDDEERIYSPDQVHVDFEQAPIKSLQSISNALIICACFFHFFQANIKKIGQLGLKMEYMLNNQFRIHVTMLILCAFLPHHQILHQAQIQLQKILDLAPRGKKLIITTFVNYFRNTWLKRYRPELWCVFLNINRTSNLLERNNKELKQKLGPTPYFWDWVAVIRKIDADATQEYERLIRHGASVFDLKKPNQRRRDSELWQCMVQHENNQHRDPQKYLLSLSIIYSKRTDDQQELLSILGEYENEYKNEETSIDLNDYKVSGVCYIEDSSELRNMRSDPCSKSACVAASDYIKQCAIWKEKTRLTATLKKAVYDNLDECTYKLSSLLNGIVAIKFGKCWYGAVIGFIEGQSALIFTNDKRDKYEIVVDMSGSIQSGHVKIL